MPEFGPFDGFLFDLDGTLLHSLAASERAWADWAVRIGAEPDVVISFMHGRRAGETVTRFCPSARDPAVELDWINRRELDDLDTVRQVDGAADFLRGLPHDRWAVVTSSNRPLALRRLDKAGLPVPSVLVTADDVAVGKPSPEGYVSAARMIGSDPARCAVFEDSRTGVLAGCGAGAVVFQIAEPADEVFSEVAAKIATFRQVRVGNTPAGYILFRL